MRIMVVGSQRVLKAGWLRRGGSLVLPQLLAPSTAAVSSFYLRKVQYKG